MTTQSYANKLKIKNMIILLAQKEMKIFNLTNLQGCYTKEKGEMQSSLKRKKNQNIMKNLVHIAKNQTHHGVSAWNMTHH